jgi:DNA-directed RNA polymerase specialized sigma24 family protein
MVKAILPAESLHSSSEEARSATIDGASPDSGASVDFRTIYRQHHASIWRFLLHLGVRKSDVPDVTHNVFLIAYRKLPGFEHRSSIRTWLCGIALGILVLRNRALRHRRGNVKVRRRRSGRSRWTRGYGVWVHDVFAFRGSPAAWAESLIAVQDAFVLCSTATERKKLRKLGPSPVIARFIDEDGEHVDFAITSEHELDLLGPLAAASATKAPAARQNWICPICKNRNSPRSSRRRTDFV